MLALLGGCGQIIGAADGEPCSVDDDCDGYCFEGVCHGIQRFTCQVGDIGVLPCLRPLREDETVCNRRVRAGHWHCPAPGQKSNCEGLSRDLRVVADNGCDDDNDGEVDEAGHCPGPLERGFFVGEHDERLARPPPLSGGAATYGRGAEVQEELVESCAAPDQWGIFRSDNQHLPWTRVKACEPPPEGEQNAMARYEGAWLRWTLPRLDREERFNLRIFLRRPSGAEVCAPRRPQLPEEVMLWIEPSSESGLPPRLERARLEGTSARMKCALLGEGINDIYVLDHGLEGCSCNASDCDESPVISPGDLDISP